MCSSLYNIIYAWLITLKVAPRTRIINRFVNHNYAGDAFGSSATYNRITTTAVYWVRPAITMHRRSTATKLHFVQSTKFRSHARYDSAEIKSHDLRNSLGKTSMYVSRTAKFRRGRCWFPLRFYDTLISAVTDLDLLGIELVVIFEREKLDEIFSLYFKTRS